MATRVAIQANDQEMSDGMAEIELQRLQRQYRIMEGDRKAYSEESRILIGKQRSSIEKLKKDNEYLQDELRLLEKCPEDKRKNGIQSKKADGMTEQADILQRKIKYILAHINSLDQETGTINTEIDAQRSKLGGVNAAKQNSDAIGKQVRVLENRLDKALVKFNKSLAVNRRMRSVIDNLRRERLVFDNIYHKFEKDLTEQKKQMADIIETSNAAYEARDEAQTKIIALREKAEKEYQSYIQEIKEIDRTLEQDRKLKEFMAAKSLDRSERADGMLGSDKKGGKDSISGVKSSSQENLLVPLDTYENAFAEIRKVTGISNTGELVQRFKSLEDQNFSLFNYVNEVNNEIELHAKETMEIQKRTDTMRVDCVKIEETRRKEMCKLEESLNTANEKVVVHEKQCSDMVLILDDLRNSIEGLISAFQETSKQQLALTGENNCKDVEEEGALVTPNTQPIAGSLHSSQQPSSAHSSRDKKPERVRAHLEFNLPSEGIGSHGVTEANLIQFLGLIEHKSNELLTLNYLVNSPKKTVAQISGVDGQDGTMLLMSSGGVAGLLGQGPGAPIGALTIVPPSTGDDRDSGDNLSEEDDRPLTRDELRQKTLRGLNKREKTATPGHKVQAIKNKRKTAAKKD
ncbi:hypothetical protein BASA61_004472 [Batrachochytrium salamandrivorans]|nr:hypothetical protein BASA61_004472 [Batrachochytrium salamandrivorans]